LIRSLGSKVPKVHPTAWVSEAAYVVGNVEIGEHASIWPGVTIRGDGEGKIVIGAYVNIQENSVIHNNQMVIEDYVSIGHCVVVHCERIGEGSLMGNNSTILNRTTMGKRCLVAANAVVLAGQDVPDESFVTGVPGVVKRQVTKEQVDRMRRTATGMAKRGREFKAAGL
jgi:carbonic anhydrase/acetyltransferase-like protein (isoleucine patch superfamily)